MIGVLTKVLLERCCPETLRPRILELLSARASQALPGVGSGPEWHELIDRIQLACIRGSQWKLDAIEKKVEMAETDFRDLLMVAGFGELDAHRKWHEKAIRTCDIEQAGAGQHEA